MKLIETLLKIRNYMIKEDYKNSLVQYLETKAQDYINKPANSLLDGYILCLRDIKDIPEIVENRK